MRTTYDSSIHLKKNKGNPVAQSEYAKIIGCAMFLMNYVGQTLPTLLVNWVVMHKILVENIGILVPVYLYILGYYGSGLTLW